MGGKSSNRRKARSGLSIWRVLRDRRSYYRGLDIALINQSEATTGTPQFHLPPFDLPSAYVTLVQKMISSKKPRSMRSCEALYFSSCTRIQSNRTPRNFTPERPPVLLKTKTRFRVTDLKVTPQVHGLRFERLGLLRLAKAHGRVEEPFRSAGERFHGVRTVKEPSKPRVIGILDDLASSRPFGTLQAGDESRW